MPMEGLKDFSFDSQKMEIKSDGKNYYFEGYLENFEEDSVKDICTRECLIDMANQLNLGMKGFVAFTKGDLDHDTTIENNPFKTPISKIIESNVDATGLFVKGMFNPDNTSFTSITRQAENGFLDGLSITYQVKEYTPMENGGRILNKVQLKGYAHTPRPVCNKCRLTKVFAKSLSFTEEAKGMMADNEMESMMGKMDDEDMKKMMEKMKKKMGMNDKTDMNKKSEGDIVEEQKSEKVEVKVSEKLESKSEEKSDKILEEMKSRISELEKKVEMKSVVTKEEMKSALKEMLKDAPVENKSLVQDEQKGESANSPITLKGVLGVK